MHLIYGLKFNDLLTDTSVLYDYDIMFAENNLVTLAANLSQLLPAHTRDHRVLLLYKQWDYYAFVLIPCYGRQTGWQQMMLASLQRVIIIVVL